MTAETRLRLERLVCVAPAVAAVATYTTFVVRNAVNVVYLDYWASIPVLHAVDDGRFRWSQLWTQAANNRVVVPRAITLAVGRWFRLDTRFEIIGAVAFLAIAAVLFMVTQHRNDGGPLYLYAPVAFFLFSLVQWQTALWNVQMPRFLILALFALATYAVCRSSGWGWFAVAVAATAIASLSLLDGLLLWPAIAVLIWCDGRPHRARRFVTWVLIGLFTAVGYFIGFNFGEGNSGGTGWAIRHPLAAVQYVLTLLGGFSRATPTASGLAVGCGVLMVGLLVWVVARFWRSDRRLADAVPMALVVFVFLFDMSTLLGRGSAGPGQALASRYTTYNLLVFVAAYLALVNRGTWRVAEGSKPWILAGIGGVGMALAVLLAATTVSTARHEGNRFAAQLRTSAKVLRQYRTEPASQLDTYLCPTFCRSLVLREAPFLQARGYSVFAGRRSK